MDKNTETRKVSGGRPKVIPESTTEKQCTTCQKKKQLSCYYKLPNGLLGVTAECKQCKAKRYKDNADAINKRTMDRYYERKSSDPTFHTAKRGRKSKLLDSCQ